MQTDPLYIEMEVEYARNYMDRNIHSADDMISMFMRCGRQIRRGPERERIDPWMKAFELPN